MNQRFAIDMKVANSMEIRVLPRHENKSERKRKRKEKTVVHSSD